MKNKTRKTYDVVIVFLFLAIFLVSGIDIWLFAQDKKEEVISSEEHKAFIHKEGEILDIDKKIICTKKAEMINPDNKIHYNFIEDYSVYVTKNKEIISDGDLIVLTFFTLNDLNTYYDYLVNDVKVVIYQDVIFTKDIENLTITYKNFSLQGGTKIFDETFLEKFQNKGYECQVDYM